MPKVTFKSGGDTKVVEAAAGRPLKEIIKENDWPVLFACEDGVCGTCLVKVVHGIENLTPIEEKERQTLLAMGMDPKKYRLCCQCEVNGDVMLEQ